MAEQLEVRDFYKKENVFWVPANLKVTWVT